MLMKAGLVDGEEATTIQSDSVQASCVVTSSTDRMSLKTGEINPPRFLLPACLGMFGECFSRYGNRKKQSPCKPSVKDRSFTLFSISRTACFLYAQRP